MKHFLPSLFFLFCGVLIVGLIFLTRNFFKQPPESNQAATAENIPSSEPLTTENPDSMTEAAAETSPLSLPALFDREYTGSALTLGALQADEPRYTRQYVTYKAGVLTISGTLHLPKGGGPFPVVIANHGFIEPSVYTNGRGLRREEAYLANQGYAVLHPDYRGHAESEGQDTNSDPVARLGYVEDVIGAVHAVKSSGLKELDTTRIGLLGHSMGGGIVENILVINPDLVQAAVLFAPISGDQYENFQKFVERRRPEVARQVTALFGNPESNPSFWKNISANSFADRVKTPVMIHHGLADDSCDAAWSERYVEALKKAEKSAELFTYPGEPHEFAAAWPTVMTRTTAFFDQHLKP